MSGAPLYPLFATSVYFVAIACVIATAALVLYMHERLK